MHGAIDKVKSSMHEAEAASKMAEQAVERALEDVLESLFADADVFG